MVGLGACGGRVVARGTGLCSFRHFSKLGRSAPGIASDHVARGAQTTKDRLRTRTCACKLLNKQNDKVA